jgi:hypothetical protein
MGIWQNTWLNFWEGFKKRCHCFFQSTAWLIISAVGLLIPVVVYYGAKVGQFQLIEDFSIIKYLFTEKNLLIYSLTIIIVISLAYRGKADLCDSKIMKNFSVWFFTILIAIGGFLYSYIVAGNDPCYCSTPGFQIVSTYYSGVCVLYTFVVKYHIYFYWRA